MYTHKAWNPTFTNNTTQLAHKKNTQIVNPPPPPYTHTHTQKGNNAFVELSLSSDYVTHQQQHKLNKRIYISRVANKR